MRVTLDDVVGAASRLAGLDRLLLTTPQDHFLAVRRNESQKVWELPGVDEIDFARNAASTVNGWRADAEDEVDVPGMSKNLYFWPPRVLASDAPHIFHPSVHAALRQLDDPRMDATSESGETHVTATVQDLQRQIDQLTRQAEALKRQAAAPVADRSRMLAHQVKAQAVYQAFGDTAGAPPFASLENERDYAIRLVTPYLKFSKRWKGANLKGIGDVAILDSIADEVYADAMSEAKRPTAASLRPGELRAIRTTDASGRPITSYVGADAGACWDAFCPPIRYVRRFNVGAAR